VTPAEAVLAVRAAGHIVIIHGGAVFFNTTDEAEARKWESKGALLVPHYSVEEHEHRKKKGRYTKQGWEVHFLGALPRIEILDTDGAMVDVTKDHLLAAAREKVSA
jgi:hypothetical protein